jgi:hypothetical protein
MRRGCRGSSNIGVCELRAIGLLGRVFPNECGGNEEEERESVCGGGDYGLCCFGFRVSGFGMRDVLRQKIGCWGKVFPGLESGAVEGACVVHGESAGLCMGDSCTIHGRAKLELGVPRRGGGRDGAQPSRFGTLGGMWYT